MTVIHGRVWPDHVFPEEIAAFHADRNSVHDFGTPTESVEKLRKRVDDLAKDERTYRLRIAHYKLDFIEEISCVGRRPNLTPEKAN